MARIRSIKPELPQSESMGRVSRDARLLFILTWTLADDEGRLRGSSRMLASLLFPYDDDAPNLIDGWLSELVREDCIIVYDMDGSTYLQICKWLIHQKIDKPSKSKIPTFDESSGGFARLRGWIKDQGSRIKDQGREGKGQDQTPSSNASTVPNPEIAEPIKPASSDPIDLLGDTINPDDPPDPAGAAVQSPAEQVFDYWRTTMNHPQAKLDAKRKRNITARLKDGYTVAQLEQAVDGCKYDPFSQGANDRRTVYDDIELICRDGPKVDKFIAIAKRGQPPPQRKGMSENTRKTLDNIEKVLGRMEHERQ